MKPLEYIKYIVDTLQGTVYEPWVNALLFMLLVIVVFAAISFLIGKHGRKYIINGVSTAKEKINNRRGYAPEWDSARLRILPYIELIGAFYFSVVGLYSAVLVSLTMIKVMNSLSLMPLSIGIVWILASLFYMRINLESASWAYSEIKKRNEVKKCDS